MAAPCACERHRRRTVIFRNSGAPASAERLRTPRHPAPESGANPASVCRPVACLDWRVPYPPKRFVYIIRSIAHPHRRYVGVSADVVARLRAHNDGRNRSTAPRRPRLCPSPLRRLNAGRHRRATCTMRLTRERWEGPAAPAPPHPRDDCRHPDVRGGGREGARGRSAEAGVQRVRTSRFLLGRGGGSTGEATERETVSA